MEDLEGRSNRFYVSVVTDRGTREPVSAATVGALRSAMLAEGLLPFTSDNRIHVVPPCTVTAEECERALEILDRALGGVSV